MDGPNVKLNLSKKTEQHGNELRSSKFLDFGSWNYSSSAVYPKLVLKQENGTVKVY